MRRSVYVNSTILCRTDRARHATNASVSGTDRTAERHRGVARDMPRVGPPSDRRFNPNSEAAVAFYLVGRQPPNDTAAAAGSSIALRQGVSPRCRPTAGARVLGDADAAATAGRGRANSTQQ
jgi:hypothetical protein